MSSKSTRSKRHLHVMSLIDQDPYDGRHPSSLDVLPENSSSKQGIWTGKSRSLPAAEMSNEHLFNAIRYLARKGRRSLLLDEELAKRREQFEKATILKIVPWKSQKHTRAHLIIRE